MDMVRLRMADDLPWGRGRGGGQAHPPFSIYPISIVPNLQTLTYHNSKLL